MANTNTAVMIDHAALPETRLWQAVIVNVIEDWVSGPLTRQREAEQYLFGEKSDFRLICQQAGMDAEFLRNRLARMGRQAAARTECRVAA